MKLQRLRTLKNKRQQLNYKTRLVIIDKSLDFIDTFRKLVPDLKKVGSNYRAKSPFTEEKTPSFFVNERKHVWHCFSTGQGGKDIVSFVSKANNLPFYDALAWVETRFGLNKHNRTAKTMMTVLQVLNEKDVKSQSENESFHDQRMVRVYNNMMVKLIWNFKKKANDQWQVLDPIIDYIWEEFDASEFRSLNDLKAFMKWAYKLLEYFRRTTINRLHDFVSEMPILIEDPAHHHTPAI